MCVFQDVFAACNSHQLSSGISIVKNERKCATERLFRFFPNLMSFHQKKDPFIDPTLHPAFYFQVQRCELALLRERDERLPNKITSRSVFFYWIRINPYNQNPNDDPSICLSNVCRHLLRYNLQLKFWHHKCVFRWWMCWDRCHKFYQKTYTVPKRFYWRIQWPWATANKRKKRTKIMKLIFSTINACNSRQSSI